MKLLALIGLALSLAFVNAPSFGQCQTPVINTAYQASVCDGAMSSFSVTNNIPATVPLPSTTPIYTWSSSNPNDVISTQQGGLPGQPTPSGKSMIITYHTPGTRTITVQCYGLPGISNTVTVTVGSASVPADPGTIIGPQWICSAGSTHFSVPNQTGSTFVWQANGVTIAGAATNQLDYVITGNTSISVQSTNGSCNSNHMSSIVVQLVQVPTAPVVTAAPTACVGTMTGFNASDNNLYTDSFNWTLSGGGSVTSGQGTSSIQAIWATPGIYTVSVYGSNTCFGNGPTQIVSINIVPSTVATSITAPPQACPGGPLSFSVEPQPYSSTYNWTVSSVGGQNATLQYGNTSNPLINFPITGNYIVTETTYNSVCGSTSYQQTIAVLAGQAAQQFPPFTNTVACVLTPTAYDIPALPGTPRFTVSPGGTISYPQGPNHPSVIWNNIGSAMTFVDVTGGPGQCTSASTVTTINVIPPPIASIYPLTPTVCSGVSTYQTDSNSSGIVWAVVGGNIVSGQNTSNISINWTSSSGTLAVDEISSIGCAETHNSQNVSIATSPAPTIAGSASVCSGTIPAGPYIYTTETGKSFYTWTVSGGSITAGANTASISVVWNTAGPQNITVSYKDQNGCYAQSPTIMNVTVHAIPVPTITGMSSLCLGVYTKYSTEIGKTSYQWNPGNGSTTSVPGEPYSIMVAWFSAGNHNLTVQYVDEFGCSPTSFTSKTVNVIAFPTPTITGSTTACANSSNIYVTQSGQTAYSWSVAGGTITSGQATNTATVVWNSVGAQSITASYSNGCVGSSTLPVTVKALPVPTITGPGGACLNSTGNVYTTEAGATGYSWTVIGGTFTSSANTATVTWTTAGTQSISVSYTGTNGCTAASPTVKSVTVNSPLTSIVGSSYGCITNPQGIYTTASGNTAYTWSLTGPGAISSGQGTSQVSIYFASTGTLTLNVAYTDVNGCHATASKPITSLYPIATSLSGAAAFCGSGSGTYTTDAGRANYIWSVTGGGSITAGGGNVNTATVNWPSAGTVSVISTDANGCTYNNGINISTTTGCNEALSFSGNTFATIPETNGRLNLGTSDFTLEVFMKMPTANVVTECILSKRTTTSTGFIFGLLSGAQPFVQVAGYNVVLSGSTTLGDGNCHYLGARRINGVFTFFVDNNQFPANTSTTGNASSTGPLLMASDVPLPSASFSGWIGEIRIWSVGLSASDIGIFKTQTLSPQANLRGYYDMKEPLGSQTIADLSLTSGGSNGVLGATASVEATDAARLTVAQTTCTVGGNFRVGRGAPFDMAKVSADSVKEIKYDVAIYPNPVSSTLHVVLSGPSNGPTDICVRDFTGAKVGSFIIEKGETSRDLQLDGVENGLYIIEVGMQNNIVRKKIIVIK